MDVEIVCVPIETHQICQLLPPRFSRLIQALERIGLVLSDENSEKVNSSITAFESEALGTVEDTQASYEKKWREMIDELNEKCFGGRITFKNDLE